MKWMTTAVCTFLAACSGTEPNSRTRSTPSAGATRAEAAATRADPTPAPSAAPTPVAEKPSIRGFQPSIHGFAFRNDFTGALMPFGLNGGGKLPNRFGLCGGMSFAAADYFIAKKPPPPDTKPPVEGTKLYKYLFARQGTSVGPMGAMGLKFIEWMRLPDAGPDGTRARTLTEVPAMTAALKRGEPVVIGLVLVTAAESREPWNNHQVLGYAVEETDRQTDIHIYDPNFPKRDDVVLRVRREGDDCSIAMVVSGRPDRRIRGMFRMSYAAATPP